MKSAAGYDPITSIPLVSMGSSAVAAMTGLMASAPHMPHGLAEPRTEREREVLRALAAGRSNREIADQLVITEGTVKNHVSNILAKLDVRDRTQAVLRAQSLRLI